MSTKEEIVSDATFKTWPFSSDFNFAGKYFFLSNYSNYIFTN